MTCLKREKMAIGIITIHKFSLETLHDFYKLEHDSRFFKLYYRQRGDFILK